MQINTSWLRMERYNLDGHKLIYHINRLDEFIQKKDCFPVYIEVSPIGSCNHRCIFCAYDYIGYPNRKLETKRFIETIDELAECGVRSLLYAGEGEPLLHPDIDKFIIHSKNSGIDVGVYTNGHLLKRELAEKVLPYLTFVRFSFNGGSPENYAEIHGVKENVFQKVIDNISFCAKIKRMHNIKVDLGAQFVLLPENIDYLIDAAKALKEAGVDYLAIKPFVQQNSLQSYKLQKRFTLSGIEKVLVQVQEYSDKSFKVVARKNAFNNNGKRDYDHCYGAAFISVINASGDVASCLPFWDKEDFVYGNIYDKSFKEIWNGKTRRKNKEYLETSLNVNNCPLNCRPNAINEFLSEIIHPTVKHRNFI